MNKFNSFLLGLVSSSLFFGYILTTKFISKQFVLPEKFYMNGNYYRLEKIKK